MQFYRGTNVDLALNEIRDVIESSKSLLPKESSLPKIHRGSARDLVLL
ncbi:hypothetical protein bmMN180001_000139 [Borrelia miyamotoi]|nr:hypothetical protein [Borrelia miyamotoi]